MPHYYPINLDLTGRLCVLVGGGAVAERKAKELLECGARVRVVSPAVTPALQELGRAGRIEIRLSAYAPTALEDAFLVFAATDRRDVNAQVTQDARDRSLMVNVADAPAEGDFVLPSVVRRGEFCLSVSTGGRTPMLASRLRKELEAQFGEEYGAFVHLLGEMRDTIKERTTEPSLRQAANAALLDHETEIRAHLAAGRLTEARDSGLSIVAAILQPPGSE